MAGEPLHIYSSTNSGKITDVSRSEYAVWQTMFRGRFFSLSLSIESSGKTVLLPKWATEAQKVTIPSIVRIVILTDL